MTGGERKSSATDNLRKFFLTAVCREIKKHVALAASYFGKLIKKLNLRAAHTGSILIEFAVCMPVLIILLFYIHDLSKLKRYYDQTEFVAQQMVNILQNISQNREGEDKKIRRDDIKRAFALANLSIYPGKTMYYNGTGRLAHDLSHDPKLHIYYVKGIANGKASVIWSQVRYTEKMTIPTNGSYNSYGSTEPTDPDSKVARGTNLDPSAIYPTLKIKEGEEKIIVECVMFCNKNTMSNNNYVATDDQATRARKAFKCFLATPKPTYPSSTNGNYFNSVAIFSPASEDLFDAETPPK